jgi:TRAP-type C4-dicarboxylate transport system substrate-binding protein
MKRLGVAVLSAVLALAAASADASAQVKQLKIATIQAANGPWHKAMLRFKELVESGSKGRLPVQVYTDGQATRRR